METQLKPGKKVLVAFFLVWVLLIGATSSAQAQDIIYGDTVPAGDVVEKDIFLNGETIRLEGDVEGDVLAVGNTVVVEGSIAGSLVAIGGEVILSGDVAGSVYAVAGTLELIGDTQIGRSLYTLTTFLGLRDGAEIGQDLVGISLNANLSGAIGRETRLIIGPLEIGRLLLENINIATTGKPLDEILQFTDRPVATAGQRGGALFAIHQQEQENEIVTENPVLEELATQGRSLVSYLIVGLMLLWLRPVWLEGWATALRQRPLAGGGIGLVIYIVGFIALLFLFIIFLAITLGLLILSLRDLGFILGGITLSATGLAFYTFLLFVAFLSKIIVAYLVGSLILGRIFPRANQFRLWPFLLGLVLYLIIGAIPFLGWAVTLLVTFFGLGAVWIDMMARRENNQSAALEPTV